MSDGGIQFPPGQRRERAKFEPPPWEREQFDELAKTRQDEQARQPVTEAQEPQPDAKPAAPAPVQSAAPATVDAAVALAGEVTASAAPKKGELSEQQVEMLLSGLRAEEPRPEVAYWSVMMITGGVLALLGLGVTTWGVVALITPKDSASMGTWTFLVLGLLVPGLGFLGAGVWLLIKSMRQQGVL